MITVSIYGSVPVRALSKRAIIQVVQIAARAERKIRGSIEINVVGEREIQQLNRHYRGVNKPTDALSFAWQEEHRLPAASLGQMYLCYTYIARQARRFNVAVKEEFVRSLVHGLLHIVGYDHIKKTDAKRMFAVQEKVVTRSLQTVA